MLGKLKFGNCFSVTPGVGADQGPEQGVLPQVSQGEPYRAG